MTSLPAMLAGLDPQLRPGRYVFATVGPGTVPVAGAVAMFEEDEGRTLVLPEEDAHRLGVDAVTRAHGSRCGCTPNWPASGCWRGSRRRWPDAGSA